MMKLEMDLKPGDVVLLKFLACVVIAFFMGRFLILPGIEKHQNLIMEREELTRQKEQRRPSKDRSVHWQTREKNIMGCWKIRLWMS